MRRLQVWKNMLNNQENGWRKSLLVSPRWRWMGGKLWHQMANPPLREKPPNPIQYAFVKFIYADQNRSRAVRRQLSALIDGLSGDDIGLNIGSGQVRLPGLINLEISDGPNTDIIGFGTELPFMDNTVSLVILQEVLEHVDDFQQLLAEVRRVLKPGGICYCQVPFQIGFHPGPYDFWRFSRQGLEYCFRGPSWKIERTQISLGHGSGFYRIAVEFIAVTASCLGRLFYKPAKLLAATVLYPFKLFDLLTEFSPEKDRIPAGYFCVASKLEDGR